MKSTETPKCSTLWAAERFGMGEWCPQTADEFIEHCQACKFEIDVDIDSDGAVLTEPASPDNIQERGSRILVKHAATYGETGWTPKMLDGWAVVAE